MKIEVLLEALNQDEKLKLFNLLTNEIVKKPKKEGVTTVQDFCKNEKISTRLKNILLNNQDHLGEYIECLNSSRIPRCRNASINTQKEFELIRGY